MIRLGEVKSIINENYLLFAASEKLSHGDAMTVFRVIKDVRLWEILKTDELVFPIG